METAAADVPPEPSGRGFKAVLAKTRRGAKDTSSTPSIHGTENSSDSHAIRSSIESVKEKLRASRESSIGDGTTTTSKSRTLSKLIPGRIKKKLKGLGVSERDEESERQEPGQGEEAGEKSAGERGQEQDDGRGGSIIDQAATSSSSSADPRNNHHTPTGRPAGSESQSTLGDSSLITSDDSEPEL